MIFDKNSPLTSPISDLPAKNQVTKSRFLAIIKALISTKKLFPICLDLFNLIFYGLGEAAH
jgi:hypothetical protein